MPVRLRCAVCCETGRRRRTNEDNFYLCGRYKALSAINDPVLWTWEGQTSAVCAVCDGMGGVSGGELAATLAAGALDAVAFRLLERPTDTGLALGCIEAISRQIRLHAGPRASMGATLVLALIHPAGLELYNLGDSRGYLFLNRKLLQISQDHTTAQAFRDMGLPPPAQGHNGLTQYLGMDDEEYGPDPFHAHMDFPPGGRLLLCSDGLTAMVDDEAIAALLSRPGGPESAVRALTDAALAAGGRDNITALVADRISESPE